MLDILDNTGGAHTSVSTRDICDVISATPVRLKEQTGAFLGQRKRQHPCGWVWTASTWQRCCTTEAVGLLVLRRGGQHAPLDLFRGPQKFVNAAGDLLVARDSMCTPDCGYCRVCSVVAPGIGSDRVVSLRDGVGSQATMVLASGQHLRVQLRFLPAGKNVFMQA